MPHVPLLLLLLLTLLAAPPGFILDTSEKVGWRRGNEVITGTLSADGTFHADENIQPVTVRYRAEGHYVELLDGAAVYPPGVPARVINWPEYGPSVWELRGEMLVAGGLNRWANVDLEFGAWSLPGPDGGKPTEVRPFADYDPRTADRPIYNLPGRFEGYRRYTVPAHLRGLRVQLTPNRSTICAADPLLLTVTLTNDTAQPVEGTERYLHLPIFSQLRTHLFIRRDGGPWAVYSSPQREHSLRTRADGMAFGRDLPPGGRFVVRNLVLYDGVRDAFVFDTPGEYDLYVSYCSTPRDVTAGMYSNEVHVTVSDVPEADLPAAGMWRSRGLALFLHDHGYEQERAVGRVEAPLDWSPTGWYVAMGKLSNPNKPTRYKQLLDEILGPDIRYAALPVPDDARLNIPVQMPFTEPTAYEQVVPYLAGLSPVPLRLSADVPDQVYDFYPRTIPLQQAMRRLAGRYACWVHDGDGYTLIRSHRPL